MATQRWYFPGYSHDLNNQFSFTSKGSWDATTISEPVVPTVLGNKAGSGTPSSSATNEVVATNPYRKLSRMHMSAPFAQAQNVGNGTISLYIGASENNAAANAYLRVYVWVTQGNTDAVRGVILDATAPTELGTNINAPSNGYLNAVASTVVTAEAGDRVIVEIGYVFNNSVTTSYSAYVYYGGSGADGVPGSTFVSSVVGWIDIDISSAVSAIQPPAGTATANTPAVTIIDHTPTWYVFPPCAISSASADAPMIYGQFGRIDPLQLSQGTGWIHSYDDHCTVYVPTCPIGSTRDLYRIGGLWDSAAEVENHGILLTSLSGGQATLYTDTFPSGYTHAYAMVTTTDGVKTARFLDSPQVNKYTFKAGDSFSEGSELFSAEGPVGMYNFLIGEDSGFEDGRMEWVMRDSGDGTFAIGMKGLLRDYPNLGGQTWASLNDRQDFRVEMTVDMPHWGGDMGVYIYWSETSYYRLDLQAHSHGTGREAYYGMAADRVVALGSNQWGNGLHGTEYVFTRGAKVDIAFEYSASSSIITGYAREHGTETWNQVSYATVSRSTLGAADLRPTVAWCRWDAWLDSDYQLGTNDINRCSEVYLSNFKLVKGALASYSSEASRYSGSAMLHSTIRDSNLELHAWGDTASYLDLSSGTTGKIKLPAIDNLGAWERFEAYSAPSALSESQRVKIHFENGNGSLISDTIIPGNSTGFSMPITGKYVKTLSGIEVPVLQPVITLERDTEGTVSPRFIGANVDWAIITRLPATNATASAYAPMALDIKRLDIPSGVSSATGYQTTALDIKYVSIALAPNASATGLAPVSAIGMPAATATAAGLAPLIRDIMYLSFPSGVAAASGYQAFASLIIVGSGGALAVGYNTFVDKSTLAMAYALATATGYTTVVRDSRSLDIPAGVASAAALNPYEYLLLHLPTALATASGLSPTAPTWKLAIPYPAIATAVGYVPTVLLISSIQLVPYGSGRGIGYSAQTNATKDWNHDDVKTAPWSKDDADSDGWSTTKGVKGTWQ